MDGEEFGAGRKVGVYETTPKSAPKTKDASPAPVTTALEKPNTVGSCPQWRQPMSDFV